ncbi:hypothetical protein LRAMOSA10576 [Lichtheimia ramosa]|uniref:Core domain-containing protein n=1 Tax=Lichtheimia ramosa TaxID=688394 RepID=A0A077WNM8_9FUNG|nr:hypothetical protein LRAMOSA10576 [Lichtheimia ramosa]
MLRPTSLLFNVSRRHCANARLSMTTRSTPLACARPAATRWVAWRSLSYTCPTHDAADTGNVTKAASIENGLTISDNAIKQLKYIAERDNDPDMMLRILVDSGGCHGYQNKIDITHTLEEDDTIFVKDGVKVVVDSISMQFIRGSTVDFVQELIGSTFQVVDNPNAKNSCGCNISYDIDLDMLTQN